MDYNFRMIFSFTENMKLSYIFDDISISSVKRCFFFCQCLQKEKKTKYHDTTFTIIEMDFFLEILFSFVYYGRKM